MRGAALEQSVGRPAPVLRRFIRRYVASDYAGLTPGTHRGLPSRYLTLIVGVDTPIDIEAMPDPARSPRTFDAFVGGLHTSPATIRYGTRISCVRVELTPLGARAVLGVPAGALARGVFGLRDVLGPDGDELVDRLHGAESWPARFATLDAVLARRLGPAAPQAEVAWTWHRLLASGGTVRIGQLAAHVGWSRRHLGERFHEELGLSPKAAARVVRFERALRLVTGPGSLGLAGVAARCGYVDQAHLTREWRALAGGPPVSWLASEELSKVQDGTGGRGAA